MKQIGRVSSLTTLRAVVVLLALLAAKGCAVGGQLVLGERGAAGAAGEATVLGGSPPTTPAAGGTLVPGSLPMPGPVTADSNAFGIQGVWYVFSDQEFGGRTVVVGDNPYREGRGMCLHATTPGGAADNYVTWGAGIGLNLNQAPGQHSGLPLNPAPRCFTVILSPDSAAASGLTGELLPTSPVPPVQVQYPVRTLTPGTNEVCVDNVVKPDWCATATIPCIDPAELANGVAAINTVAHAGPNAGNLDFCIEGLIAHN